MSPKNIKTNNDGDYTPIYSPLERLRQTVIGLLIIAPSYGLWKWLAEPYVNEFKQQTCFDWMGLNAGQVYFLGLIVLFLLVVLIVIFFMLRLYHQVKVAGQFPLPGKKTMKPVKIAYGEDALKKPRLALIMSAGMLVMSVFLFSMLFFLISGKVDKLEAECPSNGALTKIENKL